MLWRNVSVLPWFETGAVHVLSVRGVAETLPNAPSGSAAWSAVASTDAPFALTSRPALLPVMSLTLSAAFGHEDVTVAVVVPVYCCAMPGAKAPSWIGVGIASASAL